VAPDASLPKPFANLDANSYGAIRARPEAAPWRDADLGFALVPLHRGFLYAAPVDLWIVEDGAARKLAYDVASFDFGGAAAPKGVGDIGFSGFAVDVGRLGAWAEMAKFQGGDAFRAIARGQAYGASARAYTLRTADPRGEEFPLFKAFWIEKPSPVGEALVVHAIADSPAAAAACRFTLRPGEATLLDAEIELHARRPLDALGLGAMAGNHLFGAIDRDTGGDVRPAVHSVDGLQIRLADGSWIWRPVADRKSVQVSSFAAPGPRGFGLLQRDRTFADYQDDSQHWERRPSLWIEPIGTWGDGAVEIVEIPSRSEVNENVVAFWRPKASVAPGAPASFAWRQFWCWTPPTKSPLARAALSRSGALGGKRRFIVAFEGDAFADAQEGAGAFAPDLSAAPGRATTVGVYLDRLSRTLRVVFDLDPAGADLCELRLRLTREGEPVSETWLFRWTA
ncbi:MAG: glucan biosynthesis protein, partial [Hyphomicrobiales bacterium]|nr:glucan biosynthesis protein [Hyphomicrobiales bacterium]